MDCGRSSSSEGIQRERLRHIINHEYDERRVRFATNHGRRSIFEDAATVEKFGWFLGREELSSDLNMLLATPEEDIARILLTLSIVERIDEGKNSSNDGA